MFQNIANPLPGGLIVLLLSLFRKSVKECITMFDALAKRTFASHVFQTSLFPRVLRDGKYDIAPLEQCLDEAYGRTQKMHDCPPTRQSGTKVAVTVTTTSDATTCLFSNYNANTKRTGMSSSSRGAISLIGSGYKHIHAQDPGHDILVRDAYVFREFTTFLCGLIFQSAQATSAAPSWVRCSFLSTAIDCS